MNPIRSRKLRGPVSVVGAGLLLFFLVQIWMGSYPGFGIQPADREVENARALGLPAGARLHQITLGGRGAVEHAVPTLIRALPGDAVEFRSVDHRAHTVAFLSDSLSSEGLAFLEGTGQLSGPPLVTQGSHFLLRLEDAPTGRYPFISEGHGGTAYGAIEVGLDSGDETVEVP